MCAAPVLYGFNGSTYVRTVRMVLAEKELPYDQIPVDVLAGEARAPEHRERHPFGKVPVLDVDGVRIRETQAICRYLEETRPEPRLTPATAKGRAVMNEAISLIDGYGYDALIGAAGFHLFPDFIGGADAAAHEAALDQSERLIDLLWENKVSELWLAGDQPSLADFWLAPLLAYVAMTPDAGRLLSGPSVSDWWMRISALPSFSATAPNA